MENKEKLNIKPLIALFSAALVIQSISLVQVVIAEMAKAFPDVSLSVIQLAGTIPSIGMILGQLITGGLALKVSKKLIMQIGLLISFAGGMIFLLLGASVSNFYILLVGSVLIGLGNGLFSIAMQSIIVDLYEGPRKGGILGLQSTFASAGTMIMMALAGVFAKKQWNNAYLVFLFYILVFIFVTVFLPKDKPVLAEKKKGEKIKLGNFGLGIWLCFLCYTLYLMCKYTHSLNQSLYISGNGLGTTVEAGIVGSIGTFAGMLAGLANVYIQKFLKKYSVVLGIALGMTGLLIVPFSNSIMGIYIASALIGFGGLTFQTSLNVIMSDISGKALAPMAFALSGIFANVGVMLSPSVVNSVNNALFDGSAAGAYKVAGLLMAIPLALSFVAIAFANKEQAKNQAE